MGALVLVVIVAVAVAVVSYYLGSAGHVRGPRSTSSPPNPGGVQKRAFWITFLVVGAITTSTAAPDYRLNDSFDLFAFLIDGAVRFVFTGGIAGLLVGGLVGLFASRSRTTESAGSPGGKRESRSDQAAASLTTPRSHAVEESTSDEGGADVAEA